MNRISELRQKYAKEIAQYGITSVKVVDRNLIIDSKIDLPYQLFQSIECLIL